MRGSSLLLPLALMLVTVATGCARYPRVKTERLQQRPRLAVVAFQSERFEHEVLPATRERLSFTGWYRRRPLEGFV